MPQDATLLPGSSGEKQLQEEFSTKSSALTFYNNQVITYLSVLMQEFIVQQEMMFISTADKHGECDASFRAGEKGFVSVLDEKHLIYYEFKGNGVMASMGNITENPNIGLLFLDFFETKVGLHVNGKAKVIRKEELDYALSGFNKHSFENHIKTNKFKIQSYVLIEVEEAFIHCSVHIPLLKKFDEVGTHKNSKYIDIFGVKDAPREWL